MQNASAKNFPSQNHFAAPNRLIDESSRREALSRNLSALSGRFRKEENPLMMDREQFTSAVLAAEPTLYRSRGNHARSEHDCADAAQQAILRAWEQLDSLRSTRYFKTWLVRILINECSTILRRQQRLAPYDAAAAEAILAPAADDYSDLYAAITALEEKAAPAGGAVLL